MRRLRMTTEDLFEQLRQNNVFYLEDVAWAIIETNGRMSVIRRPEEDPVTPKQLGLKVPFPGLEVAVISDENSHRSLALCGKEGGPGSAAGWRQGLSGGRCLVTVHRRQVPHPPQGAPGMKQARGETPRASACVWGGPQQPAPQFCGCIPATSSWLMPRAMASSPWRGSPPLW